MSEALPRRVSLTVRPSGPDEGAWTAAIAEAARRYREPVEPPYAVSAALLMPRSGAYAYPARTGTDLDKLARATVRGLEAGGLVVPRHVVELHVAKRWAARHGGIAVIVATAERS